ncbi:MAG: methyltransferase domain-containing protein, partial [Actinomycetes bacterium]
MRRRDMVHALLENDSIRSAWVQAAFERVPREVFVPRFLRWVGGQQVLVDGTDNRVEWLRGVYSDEALTVQMTAAADVVDPAGLPTSSSSAPSVMAGMLEALDLQRGQRVLEIGAGTGYNAALLAQRVGDENVVTVELDPQLADAARGALAEVGLYPTVHVGDGAAGVPDAAPFDRIIATAAISSVPPEWIEQLAPGGVIVANLRGNLAGGIVRLTRDEGEDDAGAAGMVGAFLDMHGLFMPMRSRLDSPYRDGEDWGQVVFDRRNPQVTRTALDPAVLADSSYRFMLQLHLAGHRLRGFLPGMTADAIA